MSRGIVIGHKILENGFNGSVDRDQLSKWLLYWDEIVYAGIGSGGASVTGNHPEDFKYLENLGVFRTEVVDVKSVEGIRVPVPEPGMNIFGIAGNQLPYVAAAMRKKLCEELSRKTDGIWTLGQSGGKELILPFEEESKDLIDIKIYEKLPVPSVDTPFEDILNYKENYRDELHALRFYLDGLREIILSSSDERRALEKSLYDLSVSLEDIRKSMLSKKINIVSDTISLYTENPSIGFWGVLGTAVGAVHGVPIAVTAAASIGIPTIYTFIKRSLAGGANLPKNKDDFAYVVNLENNLK